MEHQVVYKRMKSCDQLSSYPGCVNEQSQPTGPLDNWSHPIEDLGGDLTLIVPQGGLPQIENF